MNRYSLRLVYPIRGSDCMDVVQAVSPLMRRIQTTGTTSSTPQATDAALALGTLQTACGSVAATNISLAFDFGRR